MYKEMTIETLKKLLHLPEDYRVDACIIVGGHNLKYKKIFLNLLKNKDYKIEKLKHPFIKQILSIKLGKKRIWFFIEYGGAKMSEYVHFASMFGSKINILTGSCGALKKGLDPLSVIIPTYSYSTESSCHIYLRNNKDHKFYPNRELSKQAEAILGEKLKVYSGPMITCQGMLAETWEDICNWSSKGFYGVEMESSTVFAVSLHFKVPSTAILSIADNLIEKETVDSESYLIRKKEIKKIKKEVLRTALTLALAYVQK
jgi:purine-nucleoside phosphorylase